MKEQTLMLDSPEKLELLERSKRDFFFVTLSAFAINVIGVMVITIYFSIVFGFDLLFQTIDIVVPILIAGFSIALLAVLYLNRHTIRLCAFNDTKALENLTELRREAFNYPAISILDFLIWAFLGAGFAIWVSGQGLDDNLRIAVHIGFGTLLSGSLVAILQFYTCEAIISQNILPFLMQGSRVSDVPGIIKVPSYVRIIILVVTTAIGPTVFIYGLHLVGDASGEILLFFLGLTLFSATWQATHILTSISLPIGQIAGKLERFHKGELEADEKKIYRNDAIGRFAEMFEDLVSSIEERDFIRGTFNRYISPELVDEILSGKLELGGSRQEATVMFADIRGFTALSENMEPEEVVELLNAYLESMVQEITHFGGIPDKFIGDGLMAAWGVPQSIQEHQVKACNAAISMLERLAQFNEIRRGANRVEINIGIGLHAGPLIAGNVGSMKKMEYTVIGDTVNTASRIEALCKQLNSQLTISHQIYKNLSPELQQRFASAGEIEIRGKEQLLELYIFTG